MRQCPPGSLVAVRVNGITQFVGFADGFERLGNGATEITISVRDSLAQLVRAHVEHERTFNNITAEKLAQAALDAAGIPSGPKRLSFDAAAQRSVVTGTPILDQSIATKTFTSKPIVGQVGDPELAIISSGEQQGTPFAVGLVTVRQGTTTVETIQKKNITRITGYKADKPIKWDVGETYFAALKKDFDRAGLFLRAATDPDGLDPYRFLLSAPDGKQPAKFWLLNTRRDASPDNAVLVLPPQIRYVMTGRHTDYVVYGQAGGGKDGRKPIVGRFHDDEAASALPLPAPLVIKDPLAKNVRQANYLARKARAAECRANESFVYPIPHRHTLPLLDNPAKRAIPAPDTVIHLRDDEHGINGAFWIERVRFHSSSSGGTFTELTLLDPEHLLFGEDEVTRPVPAKPAKKRHSRSS
jgi:hypothetical protein